MSSAYRIAAEGSARKGGNFPQRDAAFSVWNCRVMRFNWSISTIAVGASATATVVLAIAFVAVLAMAGRQSPPDLTGRVQFGADGCQGFVIDHKTGFIRKDQPIACPEPAKEAKREAAKAVSPVNPATEGSGHRYSSGGRLDAVRDSFNKR